MHTHGHSLYVSVCCGQCTDFEFKTLFITLLYYDYVELATLPNTDHHFRINCFQIITNSTNKKLTIKLLIFI